MSVSWLLCSLIAPVLWAASNVIDEHLVRCSVRNAGALVMVTGIFASVPALAILLSGRWECPELDTVLLAMLGGALGVVVYFPYFRALAVAPAASVMLMWNLTPVLIVVLARIAIGERLHGREYLGLSLLVVSSVITAVRLQSERWVSSAAPWMIIASVMLAVSSVLEKAVYQRVTFTVGLGWISCGALLATVAVVSLFASSRDHLIDSLRRRSAAVLVANQLLELVAACALGLATSLAPVSLVHAIGGLQPMFVLAIAWRISRRVRTTRPPWLRTALATGLAAAGLALVHSAS